MEDLSDEILIQILKNLDVTSLTRFGTSCIEYFLLGQDSLLWKYLVKRDYSKRSQTLDFDAMREPIAAYHIFYHYAKYEYINCICDDCKPVL